MRTSIARSIIVALCALAGANEVRADILDVLKTNKLVLRTVSTKSCYGKTCHPPFATASVVELHLVKDQIFVSTNVYPINGELDATVHPLMKPVMDLARQQNRPYRLYKTRGEVSGDTIKLTSMTLYRDKATGEYKNTNEYRISATDRGCTAAQKDTVANKTLNGTTTYKLTCEIVSLSTDDAARAKTLTFRHINGNLSSNVSASHAKLLELSFSEIKDQRYFYQINLCTDSKEVKSLGIEFNLKGGSLSGKHDCNNEKIRDALVYSSKVEIEGSHYVLTASGERVSGSSPAREKRQPLRIEIRVAIDGKDCKLEKLLMKVPGWWPAAPNTAYWDITATDASTCALE